MRPEDVKARTLRICTMNGGLIDCIEGCMGTIAPKVNRLKWREHYHSLGKAERPKPSFELSEPSDNKA